MSTKSPANDDDDEWTDRDSATESLESSKPHETANSHDVGAANEDTWDASGDDGACENQQHQFTMQFCSSELRTSDPAFLRPEPASLPSLVILEARQKFLGTIAGKLGCSHARRGGTRTSKGGIYGVQRDPEHRRAQQMNDPVKPHGSFYDGIPDDSSGHDRHSHLSDDDSSIPELHSAWARTDSPNEYRHLATDVLYWNDGKMPEKPGPSSDDILEGWQAKLTSKD